MTLSVIPVSRNSTIPVHDRVLCDDIEGLALFCSVENDRGQLCGSELLTEFGGLDEQLDWSLRATYDQITTEFL
jgi:hypothetical protein